MNDDVTLAVSEAENFIRQKAVEESYGDITVTVTLNEGHPVKITKTFVKHLVQRKTSRIVEK